MTDETRRTRGRTASPEVDGQTAFSQVVRSARVTRAERIKLALRRYDPDWADRRRLRLPEKHEYALLHHTLYGVRRAAEDRDEAAATRALAVWDTALPEAAAILDTDVGPVVVMSAERCDRHDDENFLSPVLIASPAALRTAPPQPCPWFADAVRHVVAAGLGDSLEQALTCVVMLERRARAGTTNCYSVTALPTTVFADWTADALRFGEMLLHEASHSWLNEGLRAFGEDLPTDRTWFSLWKGEQRPCFGIIHAAYAFGQLTRYFRHFVGNDPGGDDGLRQYCVVRYESETANLRRMRPAIEEALGLVRSAEIRSLVSSTLDEALRES